MTPKLRVHFTYCIDEYWNDEPFQRDKTLVRFFNVYMTSIAFKKRLNNVLCIYSKDENLSEQAFVSVFLFETAQQEHKLHFRRFSSFLKKKTYITAKTSLEC